MSPVREVVQVSAGLSLEGGGAAHLARLIAATCSDLARDRGLAFRILDLAGGEMGRSDLARRSFNHSKLALATRLLLHEVRGGSSLLVFDHLGPSRVQCLVPAALRSPYLVFLLGLEVWRPLDWQRERALAAAARVVSISEHTRRAAAPYLPAAARTVVIHPGLEDRAPAGSIDQSTLERVGRDFVLIVGRLQDERYKGHDELLAAWPSILSAVPGARLVIAGGGNDQSRLEVKARALGLGASALFTGLLSEATLAELYRRCKIFALPSRGEGFGLVWVEAMRESKPCIGLAGTVADEVVGDGETGLLIADAGVEPLAEAVVTLLTQPALAAELGRRGRQRFEERYTAAAFAQRFAPLLDTVLAETHVRNQRHSPTAP